MKDLSWLPATPVAHRGYHGPGVPENSCAAFRAAVRNGYTIELDVHATKDEVLVVFHDDTLVRMTGYNKTLEDCTFAEIRTLTLGATSEKIPALADVLDFVNGRVGLLIEIKPHPRIGRLEELLCHLLDRYYGKFAVASFDPRVLAWFCRNRPSFIRGQISGGLHGKGLSAPRRFFLKNLVVALISRPDFIAYEYRNLNAWVRFVARIFRLPLLVWTIRDPGTARQCGDAGHAIIFEGFHAAKT
ncbi:MAG TPA: glycerophosphodiester phosphodiesterase family protein [Methanoregulaceae archaeon]|nr:glycerophosphodiester phosphodiesterase family protein [Methanoregulaceae archaeon]